MTDRWEFDRKIETKKDLKAAKLFLIHCEVNEYDSDFPEQMKRLRRDIKNFEKQ